METSSSVSPNCMLTVVLLPILINGAMVFDFFKINHARNIMEIYACEDAFRLLLSF